MTTSDETLAAAAETNYDADPRLPGAQWQPMNAYVVRLDVGDAKRTKWLQPAPRPDVAAVWAVASYTHDHGVPPRRVEEVRLATEDELNAWAVRVDRLTMEAAKAGVPPPAATTQALRASLDVATPKPVAVPAPPLRVAPEYRIRRMVDPGRTLFALRRFGSILLWLVVLFAPILVAMWPWVAAIEGWGGAPVDATGVAGVVEGVRSIFDARHVFAAWLVWALLWFVFTREWLFAQFDIYIDRGGTYDQWHAEWRHVTRARAEIDREIPPP